MARPYQPPSTQQETIEQLRNLHNNLVQLQNLSQLADDATLGDAVAKVNEVMTALAQITRGGTVVRRA